MDWSHQTYRDRGNPASDSDRDEIRYLGTPRHVPMVPRPVVSPQYSRRWSGESGSMGMEQVYFGCLVAPMMLIMMAVAGVVLVDWLF